MVGWLDYYEIPFIVVLTKSDKLPRSKMPNYLKAAGDTFAKYRFCKDVIPFSSISGEGRSEVLAIIEEQVTASTAA